MKYVLPANNTLIIRGQASVEALEGEVSVLGAPLRRKHRLLVGQEKQLPFEAETVSDLEIILAESAEIFEIEGSTIPPSWGAATEALIEMEEGKVMVVGATDVGKSTFCTYVTNRILKKGLRVRVVDADIGQADIGPPTTIGSSLPKAFFPSLVDLDPEALIFIGHTNPKQVESKLTHSIQQLSDRDHGSLTIINTDGWVLDPEAISYKINVINAVKPDLVIGLAAHTELQPLLSASHSLKVDTAREVLERSRTDRRQIRRTNYRRYLEGGRTQTIPLNQVSLLAPAEFPPIQGPTNRELRDLIVGLLDDGGFMLQFGIFMGLETNAIRVYGKSVEGVRKIDFGYIKLSTDGQELEYFEP